MPEKNGITVEQTDALELLFKMITEQGAKLDDLLTEQAKSRTVLEQHMTGEDRLVQEFRRAFPGDDPEGHRAYHDALIQQAKDRREFWRKMIFELSKWGLIGFLGWLVIQVWLGALKGPH